MVNEVMIVRIMLDILNVLISNSNEAEIIWHIGILCLIILISMFHIYSKNQSINLRNGIWNKTRTIPTVNCR